MTSLRGTITIGLIILTLNFGSPLANAQSPSPDTQQSAAEWAKKIAFTISHNPGAATPDNPIMSLVYAVSRGNVVEIKYVMKDALAFARLKQGAEKLRLGKTSFYCNADRIAYLTMGVVIREITTSPGGDDQLEINVDRSSCNSLPAVTRLNSAQLVRLAQDVADAENKASAKNYPLNGVLQFNGASANEGVVEERLTFPGPLPTRQQMINMTDVTRGFTCEKYGTSLHQGLTIHQTFVSSDGKPIFDFAVDGSHC